MRKQLLTQSLIVFVWVSLCWSLMISCTQPKLTPCQNDSDCLGEQRCVASGCRALEAGECLKNSDCPGQRCSNNRCVDGDNCPTSCNQDQDCSRCPSTNKYCVSGKCTRKSCQNNSDCEANEICVDGGCVLTGPGQPCGEGNLTCPAKHVCLVDPTQEDYCFQECTTVNDCAGNADDGRTTCVLAYVEGRQVGICVGMVDKINEPCGTKTYATREQKICNPTLNPPLYCATDGTCQKTELQSKEGDPCNKPGDLTEPVKTCNNQLNPPLFCDPNTGKCRAYGIAAEGQPCDSSGVHLGKPTYCASGSYCLRFYPPYQLGNCHRLCTTTDPSGCSHRAGTTCVAVSQTTGLCMDQTCNSNADCLFNNYICINSPNTPFRCIPPRPTGTADFGERCEAQFCKPAFFCLPTDKQQSIGYCTKTCGVCGPIKNSSGKTFDTACITTPGGIKACIPRCNGNRTCPPNFSCQTNGTNKVCLPK